MKIWNKFVAWLRSFGGGYAVRYVESDELPSDLAKKTLTVAREDGELWVAGMICPCGCKARLELMLLEEAKPRWDLRVDRKGRPTLSPSVWRNQGCNAHFWLRNGKILWCRESVTGR
tara:strand:- start:115 stop:465 length:351 start_codon:yes stop_codon:yes gene_type:complete